MVDERCGGGFHVLFHQSTGQSSGTEQRRGFICNAKTKKDTFLGIGRLKKVVSEILHPFLYMAIIHIYINHFIYTKQFKQFTIQRKV